MNEQQFFAKLVLCEVDSPAVYLLVKESGIFICGLYGLNGIIHTLLLDKLFLLNSVSTYDRYRRYKYFWFRITEPQVLIKHFSTIWERNMQLIKFPHTQISPYITFIICMARCWHETVFFFGLVHHFHVIF